MSHDEPDALDRALDQALARYANVDALAGIEQRVLARVRAQPAVSPFLFGRWALAAAFVTLAGMIVAAALWNRPVHHRVPGSQPPKPAPLAEARPLQKPAARVIFRTGRSPISRPAPLTREERALLAWVARAPHAAREAFLDLQRRGAEPIQVEPIRIEPLNIGSPHAKDDAQDDAK